MSGWGSVRFGSVRFGWVGEGKGREGKGRWSGVEGCGWDWSWVGRNRCRGISLEREQRGLKRRSCIGRVGGRGLG